MPRRDVSVEALRHKDKRRNLATAELEPLMGTEIEKTARRRPEADVGNIELVGRKAVKSRSTKSGPV